MNFITPEDVRVQAMVHAQDDYKRHIENNVDMNPFSTKGARNEWQRGFDNAQAYAWEGSMDFAAIYQRGKAMAEIVAAEKAKKD